MAILNACGVRLADDKTTASGPDAHQLDSSHLSISRSELADLASRCERYVGTQGGGMDQAVSLLASEGAALHVEFNPLKTDLVQLPAGAAFVVAHSLAESHKAETASLR
jgi:N-acetylgalactosamine kinase